MNKLKKYAILNVLFLLILSFPSNGIEKRICLNPPPVADRKNISGVFIFSPGKNKLTVKEILNSPIVQLPPSFGKISHYKIISFTLVIVNSDNSIPVTLEYSYDNKISISSQKIIKTLKKDSRIFIEDVKAIGPDRMVRRLAGRAIKII